MQPRQYSDYADPLRAPAIHLPDLDGALARIIREAA
jgi:hypothetical protein